VGLERAEKTDGSKSLPTLLHLQEVTVYRNKGQLSDMFAGAINNIFRNKSNSEAKRENIFAGDTVGGASASPGTPMSTTLCV
jgi:hypothetical protein